MYEVQNLHYCFQKGSIVIPTGLKRNGSVMGLAFQDVRPKSLASFYEKGPLKESSFLVKFANL